jgi:hypothetical protein
MATNPASKGTKGSKAAKKSTKKSGQGKWTPVPFDFKVQWPYNLKQFERYCVSDGVYHMWVKNTDKPYNPPPYKHRTLPRTEHRFRLDGKQDYMSGQWEYEADMMVPAGSNGMSIMQIHTGNKYAHHGFRATAFMLFWYSADGGSVRHYSKLPALQGKLTGCWFHLTVRHNLNKHTVMVWIDGKKVWDEAQEPDSCAPSFYMKDGVYAQEGGNPPSPMMEVYIKNIKFSKHS